MEKNDIRSIPGVGKAASDAFASMGIFTAQDLLLYKPRAYMDLRTERNLRDATTDDPSILCKIHVLSKAEIKDGKRTLKVTAEDENGDELSIMCFNRPYLKDVLRVGSDWFIRSPKVNRYHGKYDVSSFELKKTGEDLGLGKILPVYTISKPLSMNLMRSAVRAALSLLRPFEDPLPQSVYERLSLMRYGESLRKLHFPETPEEASEALGSLAFTELFLLILKSKRRVGREEILSVPSSKEKNLISSLPFPLTEGQIRAVKEIESDLDSSIPMNRILEGDVGSGKTLVAWISAVHMISKGYQVAYLAPTELLARQHADNAASLLSGLGVSLAFLSGDVNHSQRQRLLRALREGDIDLIIGTHALFSKDVEFKNLGYVIVDEEHRFGVKQRESLAAKGREPNLLSMSATPIPRTMALTVYADTDISAIEEMPAGRLPIITYLVSEEHRDDMYSAIEVEFRRSHQAYFVYPRIDENGERELRDVTTMYEFLKKKYPGVPSALIHSRIDDGEKIRILRDFRDKKLTYLVATSVVEVGIDVPDATCMIIEHAETYGLASLHQLRGRVGRSSLQSYCFLVFGKSLTDEAKERLKTMKETNDGFKIAEKDLEIRGPGELSGEKQSGFINLRFSNLSSDPDLVNKAAREADRILSEDPGLIKAENSVLRKVFDSESK